MRDADMIASPGAKYAFGRFVQPSTCKGDCVDRVPSVGRALRKGLDSLSSPLTGGAAADLKKRAELARAQRDWAQDAYWRRRICALEPERRGAWIQLGHALKEAGFHGKAEDAYRKALAMKPDDAEIFLQLAHLAKVRGRLDETAELLRRALELDHPERGQIEADLRLLKRVDNKKIFWGVGEERTELRVFLSAPSAPVPEDQKQATAAGLGQSDYSYSFAMRGFIQALEELEIDFTVLSKPEYVADIRQRSKADINIHIGFYPPDRMRVLKGAYNVNCFAWEFDRLRSREESYSHHAFAEQAEMLSVPDELWVPSSHGAKAVRAAVSRPVTRVPAPILGSHAKRPRDSRPSERDIARAARDLSGVNWEPLAILPRVQSTMDGAARARGSTLPSLLASLGLEKPTLYVSIFNVHDYRKQIEPLLKGFLRFVGSDPNAILLLKMSTPHHAKRLANRILLEEQIADAGRMVKAMVSDRVWITDAALTRGELNRLYDAAAFYVCTSHAEGQNLPLLEAMARGVVPITVNHTAMADYISDNDAVVIPSQLRPLDIRLAARYRMYGVGTYYVDAADVHAALAEAERLTREEYAHRSAASWEEVKSQFGVHVVAERIQSLVQTIKVGAAT